MQPTCIHCLTTQTCAWPRLTVSVQLQLSVVRAASHQSVARPQQEVWLYPRQMELWKGLGSFDMLQLVYPRLFRCVVFAGRILVSWTGVSVDAGD